MGFKDGYPVLIDTTGCSKGVPESAQVDTDILFKYIITKDIQNHELQINR